MLLERSATAIQKVYRGRLDRELYQFRYRHWWYHEKYIPAVILVQSYGRMFVCQRDYLTIKRENNAATFIQLQYWASIARAEMKRRWAEARLRVRHQNAAQIQKISESLDRTAAATSHLLHHYHVLQHTVRIFRFGCAVLSKDAMQISLAAIRAKAPLQEAQQQGEFAYWIAVLDLFSNASRSIHESDGSQSVLRNTLGEDMSGKMISTVKALGNQSSHRRTIKLPGSRQTKKNRRRNKRRRKR